MPTLSFSRARWMVLLLLSLPLVGPQRGTAQVQWGENHPDARWKTIQSPHFRVVYPERSAAVAARALAIAEERFLPITSFVGGAPPGRTDIVLTDWADRSGGMSYSAWPRIEIEAYPLDRRQESIDFLSQVIAHELTHIAFYYAVGGVRFEPITAPLALSNIPDWWVEGLSSATEKPAAEAREQDWVRLLAATGGLPRLRRLDTIDQGDRLDALLVYWVGESKMRWFVGRFGRDAVAEVHRAMRPIPYSFDQALRQVTGLGEDEIHALWTEELSALATPPADRESVDPIPLPSLIERPISFAFSPQGDLAVVAVRDEDVWWPELYVQRWWEESPRLVETEAVGPDVAWSPDGRNLVYARRTAGPSGEPEHDLFVYHAPSGTTRRLARGVRAVSPVWQDHPSYRALFALGYDAKSGASLLLAIHPETGETRSFSPPPEVVYFDDLAAGKGAVVLTGLTDEGRRDLYAFSYRPKKGEGRFRRLTDTAEAEFDPYVDDEGRIVFSTYQGDRWALGATRPDGREKSDFLGTGPAYLRHAAPGPSGFPYGLSLSGRYGSYVTPLLLAPPGRAHGPEPSWHRTAVVDPPGRISPGAGGLEARSYQAWAEIRPRPEISVPHISTEEARVLVRDLLADPVNRHRLSLEGSLRYDGDARWVEGVYENRLFLPTFVLEGLIATARGGAENEERRERRGAAATLHLPFRAGSIHTGYSLALSLSHSREEGVGGSAFRQRESFLSTRLTRRVARPRHETFLSLRHERGVDLWHPSALPEKLEMEGTVTHAFLRNDAFFSLSGWGARAIGSDRRILTLYPSNIQSPIESVQGETVFLWGAGVSYPWSEDLGWSRGPFYLERLVHRVAYREGRAWDPGPVGPIRSLTSELDLTLFSGFFLPFFGTGTTHFRFGAARELLSEASTEFYFAIDSDFWNERWTSGFFGGERPDRAFRLHPFTP